MYLFRCENVSLRIVKFKEMKQIVHVNCRQICTTSSEIRKISWIWMMLRIQHLYELRETLVSIRRKLLRLVECGMSIFLNWRIVIFPLHLPFCTEISTRGCERKAILYTPVEERKTRRNHENAPFMTTRKMP